MSKLSRRKFLALTAVVLEVGYLGWLATAEADDSSIDLNLLSEKMGERYLTLFPKENDLSFLRRTLRLHSDSEQSVVKKRLRDQIHQDFSTSKTFRFEGWVVSRTEGRLCALRYLGG